MQLRELTSLTVSTLDAPANKLARWLTVTGIKRVLQNSSMTLDFDEIIHRRQVVIIRGAVGTLGESNTSVLMQLALSLLTAALARQQDIVLLAIFAWCR